MQPGRSASRGDTDGRARNAGRGGQGLVRKRPHAGASRRGPVLLRQPTRTYVLLSHAARAGGVGRLDHAAPTLAPPSRSLLRGKVERRKTCSRDSGKGAGRSSRTAAVDLRPHGESRRAGLRTEGGVSVVKGWCSGAIPTSSTCPTTFGASCAGCASGPFACTSAPFFSPSRLRRCACQPLRACASSLQCVGRCRGCSVTCEEVRRGIRVQHAGQS